jgi:predicted MFS family arabinose efflux permease/predicted enzyme related to lactoylglutathione lyase
MGGVMLEALRIRDFRLLWTGSLISSVGSWLLTIAIPAHVLMATGSLRDTGLTLAAQYLPMLILGPVAGVFADRWDRRRLMTAANVFCAGSVALMLSGTAPGRYWILYVALIAENSGAVLIAPALQARTPAVVGTGALLSSANSLNSVSSGAVRLIGGPLGGMLLAACGIRTLICADCASYALAAAAMFLTSRPAREPSAPCSTGGTAIRQVARDFISGARVLRGQRVARALLPVAVVFLAANASLSALLIPFGIRRLGGGEHTGFLLSCLGAGYLLGAPVIRALLDRVQPRTLLAASLTATAGGDCLLFTSSSLGTALPAAAAVAASGSMSLVTVQTTLQRLIPNTMLGRVSAIFLTGEAAATLAGAVAGPFLAQLAGLRSVAVAASLLTLGAAALARLNLPRAPETALVRMMPDAGKERVMNDTPEVSELRLVVTADDYEQALRFYRDVLGLPERAAYSSPGGRVTILEAGRATLELADPAHAGYIDEVEVGRRVAGHIRVAFQVSDAASATGTLAAAGAQVIAEPTPTPWHSLNSRLQGPAGLQLTLFSDLP